MPEPNIPAVPDEPHYPVEALQIFDRHDRASWERAVGEQAPPWDPKRLTKTWADPAARELAPDKKIKYNVFDHAARKFTEIELTAFEASTPNLKGAFIYPEYIVPSTPAVIVNPDGGEGALSPRMICYRTEAQELADELNATSVVENRLGKFRLEWRGEQRRMWLIRLGANLHSAALLLLRKYRNGVGAPGKWIMESHGQPTWIAEQQETGVGVPGEVPIPSRPLADNEALYLGHPMKVTVYRTDMESDFNKPDGGGSTAFPADLRATLERIDMNLQQLLMLRLTGKP